MCFSFCLLSGGQRAKQLAAKLAFSRVFHTQKKKTSKNITPGPYNVISNWDYVGLIKSMHNAHGGNSVGGDPDSLFAVRCRTERELDAALEEAKKRESALCFIEVIVDKDDCSKELLEWGSRVAAANGRAPNPQ